MATIADLTGETISSSYGTLLMVTNTTGITSDLQTVQSGLGVGDNVSALQLSSTVVGVNGTGGLQVDNGSEANTTVELDSTGRYKYVEFHHSGARKGYVGYDSTDNVMRLYAAPASSTIEFGTVDTAQMHIDASGNVGIGLTPSARLDVTTSDPDVAFFRSSDATTTNFYINNTVATTDNTANLVLSPANNVGGAKISAIAIEDFSTSANRTADLAFYTRLNGSALTERMRIDSVGRVGIGGTPIADSKLDVSGAGTQRVYVRETSSTVSTKLLSTTSKGVIGTETNHDFEIATNDATRLTIDSSGNVGIGVSPSAKLDVYSSATKYVRVHEAGSIGDLQVLTDNGTVPALGIKGTGTADLVNVWDGSTEVFTILDGGNVGIGETSPSTGLEVGTTNYTYAGTDYDIYGFFGSSESGGIRLGNDSVTGAGVIGNAGTESIDFVTYNGSAWGKRMTISSAGNVSITKDAGYSDFEITRTGTYTGTDTLGHLMFYYGTDSVGGIGALRDGADDAAALQFFTQAAGGANTERMRIDSSGFVGIGDDSPGRPLVVSSSQNIIASLESTDADVYITLSDNGSTLTSSQRIGVTGDDMHFWTDSVERMRIDSSGNVIVASMPTSDPAIAGALWSDSGTVKISAG